MATNKETALDFLMLCSEGASGKAFEKYTVPGFIHHNAWFKGDAHTIMKAMEENATQNPGKVFEPKRALEDGDLVAVHSFVKQNAEDRGAALVHIFRFEGNLIAEMWDLAQEIPQEMINENGMF
jgi:predicted SnoaL-like aldol condensation-catalyzing enzyme